MRLKKPAAASIGIDADAAVINNFKDEVQDEVPNLKLFWGDAISYLLGWPPDKDTLVYLDPPYLMSTRSCKRPIYEYEFYSDQRHIRLLEIIKQLNCMVIISGYYSDLYSEQLQGWRTATFQAQTRGGRTATEWVWMNYPAPLELHDYRYLGQNFRERERIKRKQARWKNRLAIMPDLERHALLSAIEELRDPATS